MLMSDVPNEELVRQLEISTRADCGSQATTAFRQEALRRLDKVGMIKKDPQILSLRFMARALHIPAKWLKDEAEAGRVPCLRAGRTLLFHPESVEKALVRRAKRKRPVRKGRSIQ